MGDVGVGQDITIFADEKSCPKTTPANFVCFTSGRLQIGAIGNAEVNTRSIEDVNNGGGTQYGRFLNINIRRSS